jgi:hypothetical protein
MQAGRWIGAKAKVQAHILRDASRELDDAVINKEELLKIPVSA